ncbi:MAG: histidine phosphatase family protein [Bacteriovorax sp.]|jgi:probable phosphoglycerate mutase|nr:histidine phosphatase family protein [Bacteriovorax sp.]
MNRVFYIFRHGETDWNRQKRCQGHTNTHLNDNGLEQAEMLSQKMLDFPLDIVVSSDLSRALKTGEKVAFKKGIPLTVDARLREMSYGEAEGLLYEEAIEIYGAPLWQRFQCFNKDNDHVCFPGGETRKNARERFHQVLMELIETTNHRFIGISTHGGALRNILHSFLPEEFDQLPIPNCVVYKCVYLSNEKKFQVDPNPI